MIVLGTTYLATQLNNPDSDDRSTDDETSNSAPNSDSPSDDGEDDAAASLPLTDARCIAAQSAANSFRVAGLLPVTGNLSFLGPPASAGVGLAVSDIQASGGVNQVAACHSVYDSSDSLHLETSTAAAGQILGDSPSVVIGPLSSTVALNVVDTFAQKTVTMMSPGSTASDLSGYSPFYFRTIAVDPIQADALGQLILRDGHRRVGFLVFNDTYGIGLRNSIQAKVERGGAACVYGCRGDDTEFSVDQTKFASQVGSLVADQPDAVVVLAFDQTDGLLTELSDRGFDLANVYLSDGNTSDYSGLDHVDMNGAKGTIPGVDPPEEFKTRLSEWYDQFGGGSLPEVSLAAEAYDATILAALAAVAGGSNDSKTVQSNLAIVSGATGGRECSTFPACVDLLEAGKAIHYQGPTAIGPFDDDHDPSSAFVGVYAYDADNHLRIADQIEGHKR